MHFTAKAEFETVLGRKDFELQICTTEVERDYKTTARSEARRRGP